MASSTGNRTGPSTIARPFAALAGAVLLLGIANSMVGAYLVLFAADHAHLSPVQVGVFVSAPAAGGIAVSAVLGGRFDRRPTRAYAIVAAGLSALGYVLLTTTTSFPVLVVVALTFLAAQQAVFPQLFALARAVLGDGTAGQRSAPLLRSGWSLAWALGPLAGAALLSGAGFTGLLWAAAAVLVLTALSTAAASSPRRRAEAAGGTAQEARPRSEGPPVRPLLLGVLVSSVALFHLAMFAGSVALPLYVTRGLHQPDAAVGLLYSACAVVEVLAALALAGLPQRTPQRGLIAGGMAALAIYFASTVLAQDLTLLFVGQLARGLAIAVVGAAGIRFFQDLLAPAVGRATTLFANAATAGSLLAGVLAGLSVQQWGYLTTLALCGCTALAAAAAFTASTSPGLTRSRPPAGAAARTPR